MTLLAATFFAFGITDLVRSHVAPKLWRTMLGIALALIVASGIARLAQISWFSFHNLRFGKTVQALRTFKDSKHR